jgi:hypothetical protein
MRARGQGMMCELSTRSSYRIHRRVFVTDLTTPAAADSFNVTKFAINPTNEEVFGWLAPIAANFTTYKLHNFRAIFIPVLGTETVGNVSLAPNIDPAIETPQSQRDMLQLQDAITGQLWMNIDMDVDSRSLDTRKVFFTNQEKSNISVDNSRSSDAFELLVATDLADDNVLYGQLWAEYDIELMSPAPSKEHGVFSMGRSVDVAGGAWFDGNAKYESSLITVQQLTPNTIEVFGTGVFDVAAWCDFTGEIIGPPGLITAIGITTKLNGLSHSGYNATDDRGFWNLQFQNTGESSTVITIPALGFLTSYVQLHILQLSSDVDFLYYPLTVVDPFAPEFDALEKKVKTFDYKAAIKIKAMQLEVDKLQLVVAKLQSSIPVGSSSSTPNDFEVLQLPKSVSNHKTEKGPVNDKDLNLDLSREDLQSLVDEDFLRRLGLLSKYTAPRKQ